MSMMVPYTGLPSWNAVENDDVTRICLARKQFILAIFLIFFGWLFCRKAVLPFTDTVAEKSVHDN